MKSHYKTLLVCLLFFSGIAGTSTINAQTTQRSIYEIRKYHITQETQENRLDNYFKNALLPALKRSGIEHTGVFKPIEGDSAYGKAVYVFIPYDNFQDFMKVSEGLGEDQQHLTDGKEYIDAPHNNPPYERYETILLKAFKGMPQFGRTKLDVPPSQRIYELRSYESATEKLFHNKVKMFDEGEIEIFDRLGFNAIFYGEVIAGCNMPNLMYMTTHKNLDARDKNWRAFGSDSKWREMSSMEEYANNVSHIDITLLRPTDYSGI